MRWQTILRLTIVATVALGAVLFTVQNSSRTTGLSFDLYVYAWQLDRPVAVPLLLWSTFGAGLLLAGVYGWSRSRGLARRVAQLQQEALLKSAGRPLAPAAKAPDAAVAPGDDWGR